MTARCGRFAPSPTGPLHAGSLVAALASWLDARAHAGRWLVRIEDVDTPRCDPQAGEFILGQLARCGLLPDEAPLWQSQRSALYDAALQTLVMQGQVYACSCSRRDILRALHGLGQARLRHAELVYPGTCRNGLSGLNGNPARAMRVRSADATGDDVIVAWCDRRLGPQQQNVTREVGDFVLKRADGLWTYQLAVVVDDAAQGVSHVVRGEDLAHNTPRQIHLQRLLGLPQPAYLHVPLVRGENGEKLAKSNGAQAVDLSHPVGALTTAAAALGLAVSAPVLSDWLAEATRQWCRSVCGPAACEAITQGARIRALPPRTPQ